MTSPRSRDVVDELTQDHHEALEMLDRLSRSTNADERRDMADTVIGEVVRHSVAEEMYVYPVIRARFDDGERVVSHDTEEHEHLERVMHELERTAPTDPWFDTAVAQMSETLRQHASDEEEHQFPRLRVEVDTQTLEQMRDDVAKAKRLAPTRPHPDAPNAELFHKLAGPGVGMIDRMRDRLIGRPYS